MLKVSLHAIRLAVLAPRSVRAAVYITTLCQRTNIHKTGIGTERARLLSHHFDAVVINGVVAGGDNNTAARMPVAGGKIDFFRAA